MVTVCSWNMNVVMVWAWVLWSPYALGTGTILWFGHGCCGHRMLLEHELHLWFGHVCFGHCILLEHERYHGLGMHVLVTVYSWNRSFVYSLGIGALITVCYWNKSIILALALVFFRQPSSSALCRAASSAARFACQSRSMANNSWDLSPPQ